MKGSSIPLGSLSLLLLPGAALEACSWAGPVTPASPGTEASPPSGGAMLTQKDIEKALEGLAASPAPETLSPGAMCYEPAMAPDRFEYVCPEDGERTLYAVSGAPPTVVTDFSTLETLVHQLESCRRTVATLREAGLPVRLDEGQFCRKCHPEVRSPRLVLLVERERGRIHRVEGISYGDLRLLEAFVKRQAEVVDEFGRGSPLKDHIPRIKQLLGE